MFRSPFLIYDRMSLHGGDQLVIGDSVGSVAGLQVSETVLVILFCEGIHALLGGDDIVAEAESVGRSVAHTHVGVESGHYDGLDTKLFEEDVKVGLEESAIAPLRYDKIFLLGSQLRDDLRSGSTGDGVVSPDQELAVDDRDMTVVAVDHGNPFLARGLKEASGGRNDSSGAVAAEGAGHEVVEHVNDKDGRMIQFFHFLDVVFIKPLD